MEDIFHWCREGNAMQVRVWLDDTEHDMNQGWVKLCWCAWAEPKLNIFFFTGTTMGLVLCIGQPRRGTLTWWLCSSNVVLEWMPQIWGTILLFIWQLHMVTETSSAWYYWTTEHWMGVLLSFPFLFQLLKNKADINFVNEHGNTPLHYACFWGYSNIAEDLVNYGAYVSVANKYGEIPLDKCSGAVAKRLHGKSSLTYQFIISDVKTWNFHRRTGGGEWTRSKENRF